MVHTKTILPTETNDWRKPYIDYLENKILLDDNKKVSKIKKHAKKYQLKDGVLYRKAFNISMLYCLNNYEFEEILTEIHGGDCDEHQSGQKLYEKIMRIGYYWPTIEKESLEYAQ